jgi:hypothetical protein
MKMKKQIYIWFFFFLLIFFDTNYTFATSFSISPIYPSPSAIPGLRTFYANHYDIWGVQYDGSSQTYSHNILTGNIQDYGNYSGALQVISSTGKVGEKVPVALNFRISTNMIFYDFLNSKNFSGSEHFDAWIDYKFGLPNQQLSYSVHNTTNPWESWSQDIYVTLNTTLETYKQFMPFVRLEVNHIIPIASGFKVINPFEYFSLGYEVSGTIELVSVKVPEPCTIILLSFGFFVITILRRKFLSQTLQ